MAESLQSHQHGITFYRNSNPLIKIFMTNGSSTKSTAIRYENNSTTSLDPGFDAGTFTGTSTSFNIYSQLISNNTGVDFMIQSLPNSNYENMIVPIGVNATNGNEITFSAEALNLPTDIKVFLEDREANTFTRLDETNSDYKITLTQDLNGIGRFYLHTSASVLNVDSVNLDNVSIYKSDASTLRIVGLQNSNASLKLFNTLGKQLLNTSFKSSGVKDIVLPELATGVYVIQLQTDKVKLNKKIILE